MNGPTVFACYAYPPNELGYCGPADHAELLEYASSGLVDDGLRQRARSFDGAWPYLELIAESNGLADPLDRRVVEGYWLGNHLADAVAPGDLWRSAEERFRPIAGRRWSAAAEAMSVTARPTHAFHVFGIYPFVGMLRSGGPSEPALDVLQQCRIRWGRVIDQQDADVVVASRPVQWDGRRLFLGAERSEVARWRGGHGSLTGEPMPGQQVALHWDWVCGHLTPVQLARLQTHTCLELDRVNAATLEIDAVETVRGAN